MAEDPAYQIGYRIGFFVGTFMCGAIVGMLPLLVARHRGHRTFAFVAWVVCVIANLLPGVFLLFPAAIVLTVAALCLKKELPGDAGLAKQAPIEMTNAKEQTAPAEYSELQRVAHPNPGTSMGKPLSKR
jgi:hypothetical protein